MQIRQYRQIVSLVLCLVSGPALASDFDYIRGDDIYDDDYNYGLKYDQLSSTTSSNLKSPAPAQGDGLKAQSQQLQRDTTQPSMIQELKRWKPDLEQDPELDMNEGLSMP